MDEMRKDGVNDRVNQEMIVCYTRENGKTIRAEITGELVRCKDCRWHNNQNGATGWMPCREMQTPNNYYCASGERKDGGDGSTD